MSNPRVALICEGVTDKIVIEAALKSILATPFILTMLQPEVELGGGFSPTGGGWGGVYRWCRQIVSMGQGIASNVSLTHFDAIIIHIDADVATKNYAEARIQDPPHDDLPCNQPCPPAEDTVNPLRKIITGWLGASDASDLPYNWILCIPSRKTEAWIIVALFHQLQPLLLSNIECNDEVEHFLANQSAESRLIRYKDGKFKKEISIYQAKSEIITRDGNVPI